jgi:hypothetical protein
MYIWSSYVPRNKSVVGYSVGEVQACVEGGRMVQVSIECDDEDDTRNCDESSEWRAATTEADWIGAIKGCCSNFPVTATATPPRLRA